MVRDSVGIVWMQGHCMYPCSADSGCQKSVIHQSWNCCQFSEYSMSKRSLRDCSQKHAEQAAFKSYVDRGKRSSVTILINVKKKKALYFAIN